MKHSALCIESALRTEPEPYLQLCIVFLASDHPTVGSVCREKVFFYSKGSSCQLQ